MFLKIQRLIFNKQYNLKLFCTSIDNIKMSRGEKTGVTLTNVITVLENFAPIKLSESWDNTGLLVEPYTPRPISKILLTIDLTEDVAIEANNNGAEMIISYHPPIFIPMKSVTQSAWKQKIVSFLLEKQIAMYSPHTCWDKVQGGINDWLASAFPLAESRPITPEEDPNIGAGRVLRVTSYMTLGDAVLKIKKLTELAHVQLAVGKGKTIDACIKDIALCAGSAVSVLINATKVDLYVTGEMNHHDILNATQNGISVILTNHSNSERGFLSVFANILQDKLNNQVTVEVSKLDRDPLTIV